ncbi:MAG: PD40 domain-containing protein [Cyclobacteriaceae bacterium]|nr:PD40 domain-containing protein [Cyclobacteriaceae bacterium]
MIRKLLIAAALIFSVNIVYAQDEKETARQIVEIANEAYFKLKVIIIANEQYVQAAELDPENLEANYMAGFTYLQTIYKSRSVEYLLRVYQQNPDYKYNLLYMIGQGYQYGLEFEKAIDYFQRYQEKVRQRPGHRGEDFTPLTEVERRIYECQNGLEYLRDPKKHVIENMGPMINSEWDDFAPVLNQDETLLVFTTRRQDGNLNENVFDDLLYYEDIFYSTRTPGGKWGPAQNIGEVINTTFHDSNLALSADGKQLFIYRSVNGGDIYVSNRKSDGVWQAPVSMGENINSSFSENSISITPDGNTLFFSSDRPTSRGGLDIYFSLKDRRGKWGAAVNIGDVINTPYDEDGPFIDYDGKTLYFSSKGHKGMGGYDIYQTVYDSSSQQWSEPVNLGFPINTPDNDIYFVSTRDGKRGYYASAREDGLGFTDIYHVKLADITPEIDRKTAEKVDDSNLFDKKPEADSLAKERELHAEVTPEPQPEPDPQPIPEKAPVLQPVTLWVKIVESNAKRQIPGRLRITGPPNQSPGNLIQVEPGLYKSEWLVGEDVSLNLSVESDGYMFVNDKIEIPAATTMAKEVRKTVELDKLQPGYKAILRNIYFDFAKATLKPESFEELDKLKRMLLENPAFFVEIAGHTDNVGSKSLNKTLSENRAKAVVNYLIKNGINANRLFPVGYGQERPMASNDDEKEGRELNRRVEFEILKIQQF